jgi:NADPH:quinone reductase-like Zn-dependent oxidoreductase
MEQLVRLRDRYLYPSVNIDRTVPLDEASKALDYQRDVHPRGKIVIKMH